MALQRKRETRYPGPLFGVVIMLLGVVILLINDRQASRYADIANVSDTVIGEIVDTKFSNDNYYLDFEFTYEGETFLVERFKVQEAFYQSHRKGAAVEVLVPRSAPDQAILAGNRYFGWIVQLAGVVMILGGAFAIAAPLWRKFRS